MSNPFGGSNQYGNENIHLDVKSPFGFPLTINFLYEIMEQKGVGVVLIIVSYANLMKNQSHACSYLVLMQVRLQKLSNKSYAPRRNGTVITWRNLTGCGPKTDL
jgi:hypothetical protein